MQHDPPQPRVPIQPGSLDVSGVPAVPSTREEDRALLARLAAGEEAAFEEFVRDNTRRMLAVSRRIVRSDEEARDVVQEAFLQAFRSLSGFQGQARLSTWLQRIAINASLMRLRTRRRRPEVPIDDLLPGFYEDGHRRDPGPAWSESAVARIESAETRRLVREQIDRLPDDYRTVLVLRDIEGLDTDEVARILEISSGAVRVRLHRARQALRTLLDPHFDCVTYLESYRATERALEAVSRSEDEIPDDVPPGLVAAILGSRRGQEP